MMKTKNMFWAALSMTAALVMTACSSDDNMMTPAALQGEVKTIPYSVTVNEGASTNRASVDSDNKTLKFAAGDKLYIIGMNISGVLTLKSGDEGKSSGATFEGDLTYTGEGSPASNLPLAAVLVGTNNNGWKMVNGKVTTFSYPDNAYCSSVNDAVEQYSNLTGASTYSAKSFTLTQQTAFLNFEITFEDGTAENATLSTVVSNNGSAIAIANVTTTTVGGKVVAKFVLPVAMNTALSGATVKMGNKAAIAITDATLDGKVYNVKKTQAAALVVESATMGSYKCAKVYTSATNGYYIMCTDHSTSGNWSTACGYSVEAGGSTFTIGSKEQWTAIMTACGGTGYNCINTKCSSVTGWNNMGTVRYWSSTSGSISSTAWAIKADGWGMFDPDPASPDNFHTRLISAF